jgi:hypothetical protein
MGAFYMNVREQRAPYVVTVDALAYIVHVALERALAEVDESLVVPQLDALVTKLELRLGAEQRGAGMEIGEGLRLARGIVAVARGLASGQEAPPPPAELVPIVAQEIARIVAHEGAAPSALLGVSIDYARFAVPSGAARPGAYRALSWLATAPLILVAQTEAPPGTRASADASVGVATSRTHARAAMLLARVCEREIDPAVHEAWSRLSRLSMFVWGPPDDISPPELAQVAASAGIVLEDPKNIANVVTVDRLRHRVARGRPPLLFDGAGAPGRAGISMRLLGGHAPADSVALGSLASLPLPDGARALPSTLDIPVWLGAPEARASLHEIGGDAAPGYDAALAKAIAARPAEDAPSRHASVHGSLLDVLMTWLTPREGKTRPLGSVAAQRAAIESALATWTFIQHEGQSLSRARPVQATHPPKELHVTGAPLPAFVEAMPDVIAALTATVGQMKRGLGAVGSLPPSSHAMTTLAEVDDILRTAMRIAAHETNDEALGADDIAALASLPARLARLEEPREESGGASASAVPVVVEVFAERGGEKVLSSATGLVEPALMIVREPGSGRLVLAVGAHVAHHELIETRQTQSTDATHRANLTREKNERNVGAPIRAPYTASFRLAR